MRNVLSLSLSSIFILLTFSCLNSQETIIDTVYSISELDGTITHSEGLEYTTCDNEYAILLIGDSYSMYLWDYFYSRGFLSFNLPSPKDGYDLLEANLHIYQFAAEGNEMPNTYPIYDMPNGSVELPCILEHLDYGSYLDITDFFVEPINGVGLLSDSAVVGWRVVNVIESVENDLEFSRVYTQYRIRMLMNSDDDPFLDALGFWSGDSEENKPYIEYIYQKTANSNNYIVDTDITIENFPNPFNPETHIRYQLAERGHVLLQIFNMKGQLILTLVNKTQERGEYRINWNAADQPSGIYFYHMNTDARTVMGKCLLLK